MVGKQSSLSQSFLTVWVFTKLSTKRFFRDSLALFFGILFPLIFLFVFGSFSSGNGNVSFKVAIVNESTTPFSTEVVKNLEHQKVFKVDQEAKTLESAHEKISRGQLDGIIVLPESFGVVQPGQAHPSGTAEVQYNKSSSGTGQALTSVLEQMFTKLNSRFVTVQLPFNVQPVEIQKKSLTTFDYTFAGLVGFSIMGAAVFGPGNVFPELKKQGVLRRLRTTPIRTWEYFTSTMFSQATTGLLAIAIQFVAAIWVFNLQVTGNYIEIALFIIYSIFMLLGIGLAIGGWAKNERQAQPLLNIIAFPMLFLSGTFFPRYAMPEWLQQVTAYLPLTPVIDGLRFLTTEGKHLVDIAPQLGLIGIWFIVIYAIAFRVFRWE